MKHLILPDNDERRLIFYLSMEEFAAREMDGEAFFLWQVSPTVIFGRNQLMEAEVNVPFCREHGIKMFRRKSGGGCVYSDWGNIMVSYIVKGEDVTATFNTFLQRLASALRDIGVDATVSGRNDIQIGGRKVSGNAFYKVPGKSIVHGTLLFASDFERMQQAITPSAVKLQSKGVASVRQHVTNLSEHTDMPIEEFKRYLIDRFCDSERMLTAAEIARIEEIEQTYLDESFFNGSRHQIRKNRRCGRSGCRSGDALRHHPPHQPVWRLFHALRPDARTQQPAPRQAHRRGSRGSEGHRHGQAHRKPHNNTIDRNHLKILI